MNIYEEIYQENMDMLMHSLAERTQLGKQKWEELRYYPVSFIQDDDSEEREAYISHMFEMETEFNGRSYFLELSETISLPSRKADVFGTITYEADEGERKYDFGILTDSDEENEHGENRKKGDVVIELANSIIAVFEGTEAEEFGFSYARYYNQKDVKQKWKKDRLVRLGEKLMEEKRMEDFHRIVLEKEFREKLMNEMI